MGRRAGGGQGPLRRAAQEQASERSILAGTSSKTQSASRKHPPAPSTVANSSSSGRSRLLPTAAASGEAAASVAAGGRPCCSSPACPSSAPSMASSLSPGEVMAEGMAQLRGASCEAGRAPRRRMPTADGGAPPVWNAGEKTGLRPVAAAAGLGDSPVARKSGLLPKGSCPSPAGSRGREQRWRTRGDERRSGRWTGQVRPPVACVDHGSTAALTLHRRRQPRRAQWRAAFLSGAAQRPCRAAVAPTRCRSVWQ